MSRLAVLSLRNRALVALATIAVLVFGLISAGSLKQELIPSLQIPAAAVVAAQPGASPDVVERQVVQPLEQAIGTVDGVVATTSTASTGLATVTVELEYGSDIDRATAALQTAVSRVQAQLPADVEPQVLAGSLADLPVVQLAIAAPGDPAALSDRIDAAVVPLFEQVEGVRDVTVTGASEPRVQITLDPAALAAAGVSPAAVSTVLEDNGVVLPAGTVTQGEQSLPVQAGARLTSVEELRALPLTGAGGAVALGEVATVELGEAPATSYSRVDGQPALSVGLTQTPDGNTVDISHAVDELLPQVRELLGEGSTVAVVFDQAPFIEESIEGLATEGGLGLLFALIVILVFLASVRSTLISAVSIPVSLCVTFIGLQVAGFSLNILTLGALTVSIGRVVDDSIVVIENIKRHLSYGEARTRAILGGVREVAGAITSSTIATAAVFLPIALVGGLVGELFRPFALTVAIALLASLVVSLTIVPVIASAFLKAPEADREDTAEVAREREAAEAAERRTWLQRLYVPALRGVLAHRRWTVAGALAVFVGTLALTPLLQTNFIGDAGEDTVTVTAAYPAGTSLAAQDERARVLEGALGEVGGVQTVQTTVGSAGGFAAFNGGGGTPTATFALTLTEDGDPEETRAEIRDVAQGLEDVGEVTVAAAGSGFGSSTVDVLVQAADADVLAEAADQVQQAVSEVDGATDVTNDLSAGLPVVQVDVDPVAAAAAGLTEAQVTRTLAGLTNAVPLGEIDVDDASTPVYLDPVQAPETVDQLRAVVLPTAAGPVPLTSLATVEEVQAPSSISRVDGERSATVSATPADADLGALTTQLQAAIDGLDLPAGAEVSIGGVAADQGEAFADLGLALVIAIVIVYLVMVATFRSLAQPFILLVSVPFAATGALLMLLVTGTPLGVPALIGVLMLIGIVVTNAIVLIDLVNQYREQGLPLAEAVSEGARKRLRPIVMTAAATVLALTPMAFGLTGGGVFISQPLALVVIGGLISSTVLTLLLVPVLYTALESRRERRAARRGGAHRRPAEPAELQPA